MIYKEISLNSELKDSIDTEIMYEIASARADGVELIKLNISNESSDLSNASKNLSTVIRRLKAMKQGGQIQFYAGKTDFTVMSTPAHFLLNKYPEYIWKTGREDDCEYLYIKL